MESGPARHLSQPQTPENSELHGCEDFSLDLLGSGQLGKVYTGALCAYTIDQHAGFYPLQLPTHSF
jgi:hypothetical protein